MKLNMFNKLDKIVRTIIFLLFNIIIQIKCNSEMSIKLMKSSEDLNKYFYKHLSPSSEESSSGGGESSTMTSLRHQKHYHMQNSHNVHTSNKNTIRTLYQTGNSEEDLPLCSQNAVCSKLDLYQEPWLERQCRCPGKPCSGSLSAADGHTVADKTRHFKMCDPVRRLPKCRLFRDITWTLISSEDSSGSQQIMHCRCPRGSLAYLVSRQVFRRTEDSLALAFSFACSPTSTLKCQRKEPCRLFSVKKRSHAIEEVNASSLCQCAGRLRCPAHHHETVGVVAGKSYEDDSVRTYSGYCMPRPSEEEKSSEESVES